MLFIPNILPLKQGDLKALLGVEHGKQGCLMNVHSGWPRWEKERGTSS
jgi:hypothetical protein